MPKQYRKKQGLRRKRMVRRRRGYKTINIVGKSLTPIAQRFITRMKYAETVTTGVAGLYTFNLNSIFDPNATGVGHQPYAHDTFQSMYNRYRVISCSYRVIASQAATIQLVAIPGNESIAYSTAAEYKENPRCKYVTQSPNGNVVPLSGKVYIPSLTGRTKTQYMSDDRYQAVFGASPQEAAVLSIGVFNSSDTGAIASVPLNVELIYTVECFDVKNLAQS